MKRQKRTTWQTHSLCFEWTPSKWSDPAQLIGGYWPLHRIYWRGRTPQDPPHDRRRWCTYFMCTN